MDIRAQRQPQGESKLILQSQGIANNASGLRSKAQVLRSGGLKVRLAQVDCVGEFKGKGNGRVFGNDQR